MKSYILGTGGFAAEVFEWLEAANQSIEFGGFVSKDRENSMPPLVNAACVSEEEMTRDSEISIYLAIGDPKMRSEVAQKISLSYPLASFPNLIHPTAIVSNNAQIGVGNLILPFSVICPKSRMGSFNILNLYSSLGHDVAIGDFCTLSPYATLNGSSECGDMVFVGSHATVAPAVKLERGSTLSANSLATKNIAAGGLAFGVPAKSLKAAS